MLLLTCVLLPSVPCVASAGNLTFLKSAPIARFKGDDYQLMMQNVTAVLESEEPHAKGEWSNPKTKSRGMAQVRAEFIATDGARCKRLRVANEAGGVKGAATYTLCHYAGRGWLLHPDAVPATDAGVGPKPN